MVGWYLTFIIGFYWLWNFPKRITNVFCSSINQSDLFAKHKW